MDSGTTYKNLKRLFTRSCAIGMILACGTLSSNAYAQAEETADASATVVTPLSFISTDDLNFGQIIPSNTAGEVRLLIDGSRTTAGGVTVVGSTHSTGGFAGQGSFNQIVEIFLGSNTIQLTGPGAPMTARRFEIASTPSVLLNTSPRRFRIGSGTGIFAFGIGATLDVGANQTPGNYTGTWSITLNYL